MLNSYTRDVFYLTRLNIEANEKEKLTLQQVKNITKGFNYLSIG